MRLGIIAAALAVACSSKAPPTGIGNVWESLQGGGVTLEFQAADAASSQAVLNHAVTGRAEAEAFFGRDITVLTNRVLAGRLEQPNLEPECWMIIHVLHWRTNPLPSFVGPTDVASVVAYIDQRYGRATLTDLRSVRTEAALLAHIGTTRDVLLRDWRIFASAFP